MDATSDHDHIILLTERVRTIQDDIRAIKNAINGITPGDTGSIRFRLRKLEDDVNELVTEATAAAEHREQTFSRRDRIAAALFAGVIATVAVITLILTLISR